MIDPTMQQQPQQQQAEEATPEEQAQYDAIVTHALEIMYGNDTFDAVCERLKSAGGDPAVMIGTLAANLARSAVQEIRQSGQQVDDQIVAYAGFEIIAELIDLAHNLGIAPPDQQDEDLGHKAMYVAIRKYTEMADKAGEVTDQDRADAKQALMSIGGQQNGQA